MKINTLICSIQIPNFKPLPDSYFIPFLYNGKLSIPEGLDYICPKCLVQWFGSSVQQLFIEMTTESKNLVALIISGTVTLKQIN